MLVAVPGGPKVVLTESDLDDYPGMWLPGASDGTWTDLALLGAGRWRLDALEDGPNADRYGADWRRETREVAAADRLTIRMAPGGGWVARFTRE